jgi:hypothetical protein
MTFDRVQCSSPVDDFYLSRNEQQVTWRLS